MFRRVRPFFVQSHPRGLWHVETPDDPETVLCGEKISTESDARIQHRWGTKPCPWCRKILRDETGDEYEPS
jgi:hypothetical protein